MRQNRNHSDEPYLLAEPPSFRELIIASARKHILVHRQLGLELEKVLMQRKNRKVGNVIRATRDDGDPNKAGVAMYIIVIKRKLNQIIHARKEE